MEILGSSFRRKMFDKICRSIANLISNYYHLIDFYYGIFGYKETRKTTNFKFRIDDPNKLNSTCST